MLCAKHRAWCIIFSMMMSVSWRRSRWPHLLVLLCCLASTRFGLTAEWPTWELSPLQEAAEYLTVEKEDDHSYFWSFLDELEGSQAAIDAAAAVEGSSYRSGTHDAMWALTLEKSTPLIHQLSHSLLQLYLAMRVYAPTIEVHRSLRRGTAFDVAVKDGKCKASSISWAVVSSSTSGGEDEGGKRDEQVVCSPQALADILQDAPAQTCSAEGTCGTSGASSSAATATFAFDHVYPSKETTGTAPPTTVILYAMIGTSEFHAFHDLLSKQARDGRVKYVLRHYVPELGSGGGRSIPTALQGYGIYLDIKNMEYKNLDDSAPKGEASGGDSKAGKSSSSAAAATAVTFPADEEVAGLVFSRLAERKPDLVKELATLRHNLKEEADTASGTNMKVWRMRDLGIQSLQTILGAKDPLRKVQDLAQNFPSHANAISALKTKDELRTAVLQNLQSHAMGLGTTVPGSVFINGVQHAINTPIFNVFDIVKAIRDEVLLLQRIDELPLPPASLTSLLRLASDPSLEEAADMSNARIDIYRGSKGQLHYINNIEKDPQYQRWPKSLQQLLYPSWQLHAIAKNLYTLTVILDPTEDEASLQALTVVKDFYERVFPLRISLLLVGRDQVEAALRDPSVLDPSTTGDDEEDVTGAKAVEGDKITGDVLARLFIKAKDEHGIKVAASFLFALPASTPPLTYKDAVEAYSEAVSKVKGGWSTRAHVAEAWKAIKSGEGREGASAMARLVVQKGLPVGSYVMNGVLTKGLDMESTMLMLLGREQHAMARKVAEGRISDSTKSVLASVLTGPSVFSRYHPILEDNFRATKTRAVTLLGPDTRKLLARLPFLSPPSGPSSGSPPSALSLLLTLDLGTANGLASLAAALRFLLVKQPKDTEGLRLAIVHNSGGMGGSSSSEHGAILSHLLYKAAEEVEDHKAALEAIEALSQALSSSSSSSGGHVLPVAQGLADKHAWLKAHLEEVSSGGYASSVEKSEGVAQSVRRLLEVVPGEHALLVNGRIIPLSSSALQAEDLSVIVQVEGGAFSKPVKTLVTTALATADPPHTPRSLSDIILSCQSFLTKYTTRTRVDVDSELARLPHQRLILDLTNPTTAATSTSTSSTDPVLTNMRITVVLDPLSDPARRITPLLTVIRDHLQIPLRVLLAPDPEILEFPLKSYYRFSLFPSRDTRVLFQSLPTQHILTTRVDTPEPWNVQTKLALQDLDNLRCDTTKKQEGGGSGGSGGGGLCGDSEESDHTTAELTLKNMLIYGQCFDAKLREPVNGLQVVLWDASNASRHISDTLVMQNYGYFQLQAQPGVWRLRLAAGRAQDLYEMVQDRGGSYEVLSGQELMVVKKDFNHVVESLRVRKQAGKENIPLLDDISKVTDESGGSGAAAGAGGGEAGSGEGEGGGETGVWSTLSSLWGSSTSGGGSSGGGAGGKAGNETVHVFSLATGHLYERMLKIMMLSVSKRTSVPVKFWLLENFLSPAFKESAAVMAKEVGFQVEFVTYKWPDWLRQQTEKQRIIWGYKILFLDVLFPLHVKKVIYVDADQVVRADLKELWDMDLKGRPYAYTPFCTSREETLGFQFWNQGYWKSHLQGRPYHISALYVVDLVRFRRMAVGDRLRAIYDQLSRDPNSLSNLDQDLPNYAQHMVPIHSLPQEWLWCESWCSDESKATAKTIDLCNNPRYKENKLDMARRVISGPLFNESWVELDDEVKAIEAKRRAASASVAA